jgi:hypothetical protein
MTEREVMPSPFCKHCDKPIYLVASEGVWKHLYQKDWEACGYRCEPSNAPSSNLIQQVLETYETTLRAIVTVAANGEDPKVSIENIQQMANGALADGLLLHKKEEGNV